MEPVVNRTCKACRLSKLKCDLAKDPSATPGQSGASCSRCTRLNLECIQESRGNSGRSRLKAEGICALKRDVPTTAIEMLTRLSLKATGGPRLLIEPLLRRCGQEAWSRNDTRLMAWVLENAAARDLPLSLFHPPSLPGQLEPAACTPPPFIRELLGSGFSVAFVQSGPHTDWLSNDGFDQRVCSRRALHEARARPTCDVSALFSPEDEIEPFERDVVGKLLGSLAPVHARTSQSQSTDLPEAEAGAEGTAAPEVGPLHSEVVDASRAWRLRFKPEDASSEDVWVCCKVVMRCAVLRGGEEVWMVGSYLPQAHSDGSWVTPNEAARRAPTADDAVPCRPPSQPISQPPPRKRRASRSFPRDDAHASQPAFQRPSGSHNSDPGVAAFEDEEPLDADSLLQQIHVTSTEDVLRMLDDVDH